MSQTIAPVAEATEATASSPTSAKTYLKAAFDHPLFSYRLIIATVAVLLSLGLLMVISSSSVLAGYAGDPYYYGKRQLLFAIAGLALGWGVSRLPEGFLKAMAWPALLLAVALLVLTQTSLGVEQGGNLNWLKFGPEWTRFQPSEFAKLAIIVWGANDLAWRHQHRKLTDIRHWLIFIIMTFSIVVLVVAQKDQGTAMVIAAMILVIMVAAGAAWRLLIALGTLAAIGVTILIILQPYRMERIWAFLNPSLDPMGYNLQPTRSLYALASGGWFGRGLGGSLQKWGMLAGAHTDYIFAIIGEELGVFGALAVVALFAVLACVGIRIANRSATFFSRTVAIGVVSWFVVQGFVNIAVALRLVPVMGVTLPMVSYGGSSLLANLLAVGLLVGCARREPAAAAALAKRAPGGRITTFVRARR